MFYGPKSVLALLCCNLTHVCTRDKHLDSVSSVNAYCRLLSWPPATVNTFWIRFWEMLKFKRHGSQRICPTNASEESCSRNDPEYLKPEKRRRRRRRSEKKFEKQKWNWSLSSFLSVRSMIEIVIFVFFPRPIHSVPYTMRTCVCECVCDVYWMVSGVPGVINNAEFVICAIFVIALRRHSAPSIARLYGHRRCV